MKLLLAEDDRASRLILARTLERWGYEVIAAHDGAEALSLARAHQPPMVVSDWEMPGLDGPALCAALRAPGEPYRYIVLLTAHRDGAHLVAGLDAGADDFVAKPFDPAELRARLNVGRRILGLESALRQQAEALHRAVEALSIIAATDPLLNIGNRRAFEEYVAGLDDAAGLGLLLVDVDHFKQVNDALGHLLGDRVLVAVSESITQSLAGRGRVFRYGGEELVAVLPGLDGEALCAEAEKVRARVEAEVKVSETGYTREVTVSVGATPKAPGEALDVALHRADVALYAAKSAGRNRVVAA